MASSFCSLFIFVCLVCCVIVASRPHFESKNHGDAFRHRSVEPRLRSPSHSHQSLRVLPQEISGSVHRESGVQLLVDSVPASDLTLTAFVKHVRSQMPPMDATNSVFAKNAHLNAVQALSEAQLRAMDSLFSTEFKLSSERHGLQNEPPSTTSSLGSRLFGLVTYNATASQRIGNLDLLDAVMAVECGVDFLRIHVNVSVLVGDSINIEHTSAAVLQSLGLHKDEPVYGGVEWGCVGGESLTTQVPAVITRILVSATLDPRSTIWSPSPLVLVLQTLDHSFLDLFDEAAVEYVAATNVRQLLLLEPMRVLLAHNEFTVIPAGIASGESLVSASTNSIIKKKLEALPRLMDNGCSIVPLATTYNVGNTITLQWSCAYSATRLQVILGRGFGRANIQLEDNTVSGLTGTLSYVIPEYWSFTAAAASGLFVRITTVDCSNWLCSNDYDSPYFSVPRRFILQSPTLVADPVKTYAVGDTVNFEWTSSNLPTGMVNVLLMGSSTLTNVEYQCADGKGSVSLLRNWVTKGELHLEFYIESYWTGSQEKYTSASFGLSPLFFTKPNGIDPSSPGSSMMIEWNSQSNQSTMADVMLYQDVPFASDPAWTLMSSLTINPNQVNSASVTIPINVPKHILPYYIAFKTDCWNIPIIGSWCSYISSPRFMIPETTSPAFWNLNTASETQAKAPISVYHSDCSTLHCSQTTSAACRADDTCSANCQVCLDESPNASAYVVDVSCVNCWARYSTHVSRFELVKEYFSIRRLILTGTASATVNMDLTMNLNMQMSAQDSFNIVNQIGMPGLSTSFSILGYSFQFGAFVSIDGNYNIQLSAVGTATGGFDASGNVDGMVQFAQYGSDFSSSDTGMVPANVHTGLTTNKHPWTASVNALLTVNTGLVVTLMLKLAVGASTSPPLAQVQLVVAPYVITQLRFAYPPMPALTQLNSNADYALLTYPTTGCNFPHVLEYAIKVGVNSSATASVSLAAISLSYNQQWFVPLLSSNVVLLGGCFGTVLDSSVSATRVVLTLNAAALPLASSTDTVIKRDRLWQSVNTRITAAVSSALSVTNSRFKISLSSPATAVRDYSGGSTLNVLIDILPASDSAVDTNQVSSIKTNLIAQISSPSSSLNSNPMIKASIIVPVTTAPPVVTTTPPTVTTAPGPDTSVTYSISTNVRLSVDVSVLSDPGRLTRFKLDFASDIVKSLEVRSERVLVQSVKAGSLMVQFILLPGTVNEATPYALEYNFTQQFYDSTSPLRHGTVTSFVDTSFVPSYSYVLRCADGTYDSCPIVVDVTGLATTILVVIVVVIIVVVAAIAGTVWCCCCRGPKQPENTSNVIVVKPAGASKEVQLVIMSNAPPAVAN